MDPNQITPEFIEAMVDRIVIEITDKLEQLDISLDYIAGALLDVDALGVSATQATRGRAGAAMATKASSKDK
jgi:hypothetical protein